MQTMEMIDNHYSQGWNLIMFRVFLPPVTPKNKGSALSFVTFQ